MTRRRLLGFAAATTTIVLVAAAAFRLLGGEDAARPATALVGRGATPAAFASRGFDFAAVPEAPAADAVERSTFKDDARGPFLVAGTVRDAAGRPVAGARVMVFQIKPPEPAPEISAADVPPPQAEGELVVTEVLDVAQEALDAGAATDPTSSVDSRRGFLAKTLAAYALSAGARLPTEAEFASRTEGEVVSTSFTLSRVAAAGGESAPTIRLTGLPMRGLKVAENGVNAFGVVQLEGTAVDASLDAVLSTWTGRLTSGSTYFVSHGENWAVRPAYEAPEDEIATGLFAISDAEGRFVVFGEAPEGGLALRATADCGHSAERTPCVAGAEDVVVRIETWAGFVARITENGRATTDSNLRVRIVDASGRASRARAGGADRLGQFLADGLEPGAATVEVYVDGGCTPLARFENVVLVSGERRADPRLNPLEIGSSVRRIRVSVVDEQGRPVAGARVKKSTFSANAEGAVTSTGFFGCATASLIPVGADGVATIRVRPEGDDLEIAADGFVSARPSRVAADRTVVLRRYRVVELAWSGTPPCDAAIAAAEGIAASWDVAAVFTPTDGGEGWTATFSGDPNPFYCEGAGVLRFALRMHAALPVEPFDFADGVAWSAEIPVADVDGPQKGVLVPPSVVDVDASVERLRARVAAFLERRAAIERAAGRDG